MFNRKTRALLYADVTWFFGEGMLGPLFAVFAQRLGGDIFEITWAWAAYLIVAGLLIIVIGNISDKISKNKLVFYGYLLNTIFTFCYIFVNSPLSLLMVQIGLGIAAALATPTWNALYAKYENNEREGFVWGLADGGSQVFTGLAILIGGFVVVNFSFTALFIIMGIIQAFATLFLLPVLFDKR